LWETRTAATGWMHLQGRAAAIAGTSALAPIAAPRPWPIRQTEHWWESKECPALCSCALAIPCAANSSSSSARRRLRPRMQEEIVIWMACITTLQEEFNRIFIRATLAALDRGATRTRYPALANECHACLAESTPATRLTALQGACLRRINVVGHLQRHC
jgi:hypothetical protein